MRGKSGWSGVISGDVRITSVGRYGGKLGKSLTLKPGQLAVATVKPKIDLHMGHIPGISTRSIIARHGVEVGFAQSQLEKIIRTGESPNEVFIRHSGAIPIRLRAGNRTHRVYYPQLVSALRVDEIKRLRKSGDLVLGNDVKVHSNGLVEIRIHPIVYELPKSKVSSVAKKNWVSGSKRKQFMDHFDKKEKKVRTKFGEVVLTETKYVKLPKDVGLFFMNTTDGKSVHIRSLLIDPGFEGPIVMELFGLTEGKCPDTVLAWLVRPRN